MAIISGDREPLLTLLTGINASRISYYSELKKKLKELEISNEQLREAKRITDGLYEQVRQNADELTLLYEKSLIQADRLDRAITSLKSISQVLTTTTHGVGVFLQAVARTVAQLFETDYALVSLGEEPDAEQAVYCGLPAEANGGIVPQELRDLVGQVVRDRRPTLNTIHHEGHPVITVCVPMFREELLVGCIVLKTHRRRDFAESDLATLQTLANQAAIAIENARLFDESQQLQARMKELYEIAIQQRDEAERKTRELKAAREELSAMQKEQILSTERNRIAQDLHDSVAQILTSIGLNLEWCRQQLPEGSSVAERILSLKQLARNGVYEIRNTIFELSSVNIAELGLVAALDKIAEEFDSITGIESEVAVVGEVRRLSLNVETALYRVVQEALYNVFKHAQATHVDVEIAFRPSLVEVQIRDNGAGISESALRGYQQGHTFGLRTMRARVEELGGSLAIANRAPDGRGTRVQACVRLKEE